MGTKANSSFARIAARSILGAVFVGGALVARTLYQRRNMAKVNH